LPGIWGGTTGFSTKSTIRPVSSVAMQPNWWASEVGTTLAATVTSALASMWYWSICSTSIL